MTTNAIKFYGPKNEWGEFSNFFPALIEINGSAWPTTEHYFQAMKFEGTMREQEIRLSRTPGQAAILGRDRSVPMRADWEVVKEDVMYRALKAKFDQHPKLKELLLFTKDATLIEHTENDAYWGDGGNGTGKNRLGILLMRLRAEYQNENTR